MTTKERFWTDGRYFYDTSPLRCYSNRREFVDNCIPYGIAAKACRIMSPVEGACIEDVVRIAYDRAAKRYAALCVRSHMAWERKQMGLNGYEHCTR
jgi:hypothetical protein